VQLRTKTTTKKFHLKPEDKTQMAILDYCKLAYPKLHASVIKIHNEGQRSRSTNRILPRLGLRAGASDLFFALPTKLYSGLWMEVKKDGWKLTVSQEEHVQRQLNFIKQMQENGYMAKMIIGVDEGISLLNEYMRT
jgi:hypothetical protein